ncbi:MAG: glucose 1-dehydrogenase [Alphaproteobacteria bacterium]|nr:MAG: glucose 1-dehydrogenase [Alphaproteobacteria bacterium]
MTARPLTSGHVDLSGKVALITGTTSGFGDRFARIFAHAGAKVVLTGRRKDRLESLEEDLRAVGAETFSLALDVTEAASIDACVADTLGHFGQIDILVNNAGMNVEGKVVDLSVEQVDQIFDTNLRSVYLMSQAVGRHLISRGGGGGRIINIASMGAYKVLPGLAAYCASKAGVVALTKGLAREWARFDITVNAICPGYIETEINSDWFKTEGGQAQIKSFPKRRLGDVSDLDRALLMLAAPDSHFINGTAIQIDDLQGL